MIAPWAVDTLEELSTHAPFGNGRVALGVAFDGWFLPKEMLVPMFDKIKKMGVQYLTTHNSPARAGEYCVFMLVRHSLTMCR